MLSFFRGSRALARLFAWIFLADLADKQGNTVFMLIAVAAFVCEFVLIIVSMVGKPVSTDVA
jgi:hypothetical protein